MDEVTNLVDRLRGIYRIPITDGLGATGGGEEPDNPNEHVRKFETPPIQHEAAHMIEHLLAMLENANTYHELFEREWYLRGDEIERLQERLDHLNRELDSLNELVWENSRVVHR